MIDLKLNVSLDEKTAILIERGFAILDRFVRVLEHKEGIK